MSALRTSVTQCSACHSTGAVNESVQSNLHYSNLPLTFITEVTDLLRTSLRLFPTPQGSYWEVTGPAHLDMLLLSHSIRHGWSVVVASCRIWPLQQINRIDD